MKIERVIEMVTPHGTGKIAVTVQTLDVDAHDAAVHVGEPAVDETVVEYCGLLSNRISARPPLTLRRTS